MQKKSPVFVAPSILSGDFGHLAEEAKRIEKTCADAIHIDIMDGHFAPNLTLGSRAVAAINRATSLFLDVHIMVYDPYKYIEELVAAGADQITLHFEATEDVEETLEYIRKCGIKAGLAFCPDTSESMIVKYLDKVDNLLFMTVDPGFSGQKFIPEVLEKISFARKLCEDMHIREGGIIQDRSMQNVLPPFTIQVDGGINQETAWLAYKAGANSFVSGSYLFEGDQMEFKIKQLKMMGERS
jgi:ribulose-phosphate 3-epimerase